MRGRAEKRGRRGPGMMEGEGLNVTFLKTERKQTMNVTVKIEGMMCAHCEASVKKALEALPFVDSAVVSHDAGTAVLTLGGEMDEAAVKQAVESKDFTYAGLG